MKDLGFLHHHLREDVDRVTGDSSTVTVACYTTGLSVKQPQTMPELLELTGPVPWSAKEEVARERSATQGMENQAK